MKKTILSALILFVALTSASAQGVIISKLFPHVFHSETKSVQVIFPSEPWPERPYIKLAVMEAYGTSSVGQAVAMMQAEAKKRGYDAIKLIDTKWGASSTNLNLNSSVSYTNLPEAVAIRYEDNTAGASLQGYDIEVFDRGINDGKNGQVYFASANEDPIVEFAKKDWEFIQLCLLDEWERSADIIKVEYKHSMPHQEKFQLGEVKLRLRHKANEGISSGSIRTVKMGIAELTFEHFPQENKMIQVMKLYEARETYRVLYQWPVGSSKLDEVAIYNSNQENPILKIHPIYSEMTK